MGAEELTQHGAALVRKHTADDLRPVVEPPVANQIPQRADCARLRIDRTEDEPSHPGQDDRSRAHGARLERDHDAATFEPPRSDHSGCGLQCEHLGMRRRVGQRLACVAAVTDDSAVGVENDGADRNVTGRGSP